MTASRLTKTENERDQNGFRKYRNEVPTGGSPLAGRFFYQVQSGQICWQGQIIAHLKEERLLLVQTYSWILGEDCSQHLVHLEEAVWNQTTATGWLLYDNQEQFNFAYNDGGARFYRYDAELKTSPYLHRKAEEKAAASTR